MAFRGIVRISIGHLASAAPREMRGMHRVCCFVIGGEGAQALVAEVECLEPPACDDVAEAPLAVVDRKHCQLRASHGAAPGSSPICGLGCSATSDGPASLICSGTSDGLGSVSVT